MPIATPDWALERVWETRPNVETPEKMGSFHRLCDKGLAKNGLRAIAESFGSLRFAIGAILSDFAVRETNDVRGTVGRSLRNGMQPWNRYCRFICYPLVFQRTQVLQENERVDPNRARKTLAVWLKCSRTVEGLFTEGDPMRRINFPCLSIAALLLNLVFLVPGCSKGKEDLIVGNWKTAMGINLQIVFNKDDTCTFAGVNGKYRIDGNNLIVTSPDLMGGKPVDDTFTIVTLDDKNLSIQDSDGKQDFVRVQ